jgi:hypothetical protein
LGTEFTLSNLSKLAEVSRRYWRQEEKPVNKPAIESTSLHRPNDDTYQSPLFIPGIGETINRFQFLSFMRPGVVSTFSQLSMDIAVLIADLVCPVNYSLKDVRDIEILVSISQWRLPQSFWSLRLDEIAIFELKPLKSSKTLVNWQLLRLALMRLVVDETSPVSGGLLIRAQTMRKMEGIKEMYLPNGERRY